jgi:PKD repeat protein
MPGESNENNNIRAFDLTIKEPNKPPEAVLLAEPQTVELAEANIEFDGSSSKDDGKIIEYFFDFGDGDNSGWIEDSRVSHRYRKTGTYVASLAVKDDMDTLSESAATIIITVTDAYVNDPPIIRGVSIEPEPAYAGENAEISVEADDFNDDITEYIYSTESGRISGTGSVVTWHAPAELGTYRIDITVQDSAGNTDSTEVLISVVPVPVELMETIIVNAAVQPSKLTADGADQGLLSATILWEEGGLAPGKSPMVLASYHVDSVVADLSEFGGSTRAVLRDNGKGGDLYADDGVYSMTFSAEYGSLSGKKLIDVSATLADGRIVKDTAAITLIEAVDDETQDTVSVGEMELPGFEAIIALIALLTITIIRRSRFY